jgi:hypothetical protein
MKHSELQKTFDMIIRSLDFIEINIEIRKDPRVKTARIVYDGERLKENKLEGDLIFGACVNSNNVEKFIGHEIGHVLTTRDNPKLYKLLKYTSYPLNYLSNRTNDSPPVMFLYGLATSVVSVLLFPYALVVHAPLLALLSNEMIANYKAKQKGLKPLSLNYLFWGRQT